MKSATWLSTSVDENRPYTGDERPTRDDTEVSQSAIRHVVLIGPMGAGKTTIGSRLASVLDRPFLDSDEVLETREGRSGANIAIDHGVAALHELELQVFVEMAASGEPSVIAPAASVVDTRAGQHLLERQLTIWLSAPDTVLRDRRDSGHHRRTVDEAESSKDEARRAPLFRTLSTLQLDTGYVSPTKLAQRIAGEVRRIEGTG